MKTNFVVLMIAILNIALACQSNVMEDAEPEVDRISLAEIPNTSDYVSLSIIRTEWKLMGFVDSGTNTIKLAEPIEGNTFTLNFEENGSLNGVTSTNQATGTYVLNGNSLEVTTWGSTKINEIYDGALYVEAVNKVHSYQLSEKGLNLNYQSGKYLLFRPLK